MALEPNYDERNVTEYTLPDPLISNDASLIQDANMWRKRRGEVLELFEKHVYGKTPESKLEARFEILSEYKNALNGQAIRKEIRTHFAERHSVDTLIYLPQDAKKPAPIFLGLNFNGNHTIHSDPNIIQKNMLKERGEQASRWAVERILERGYGLATIHCADLMPDEPDAYNRSVHQLFFEKGQTKPKADEWGTIGAWAWGLSRALDYFETADDVDHQRVCLMGHSRLGKTAFWAGAQDERFALVIANNSGCGGAALSRRRFGETVESINTRFPHWFCQNFHSYNKLEDNLPVDQHMLLSLIAPRPLYVASAEEDLWADPKGEFLSAKHAHPVYKLLGTNGLASQEMPEIHQPVISQIGYHIRAGVHDVTTYDWERFMDFADTHLSPPL